jgi:hypothetical protein
MSLNPTHGQARYGNVIVIGIKYSFQMEIKSTTKEGTRVSVV